MGHVPGRSKHKKVVRALIVALDPYITCPVNIFCHRLPNSAILRPECQDLPFTKQDPGIWVGRSDTEFGPKSEFYPN
jgi:hypothetical protein